MMGLRNGVRRSCVLFAFVVIVSGCVRTNSVPDASTGSAVPLRAVATTTIVGDVVSHIAGDTVSLTVLVPAGTDVHGYQPTPQDITRVADADVVFVNGLGLEEFVSALIENAGGGARVVTVSEGIQPIEFVGELDHDESGATHDEAENATGDPHVWTDPINVKIWVDNIAKALAELVPAQAAVYEANAGRYLAELDQLDAWVREQVSQVPEANRKIVTDHMVLGYFAQRYGFQQVGAVVPGYSTSAEPSAQGLADLEDAIRQLGVKAIFVGNTVNPSLDERVATDTGVKLVFILTGSLTEQGGDAPTYLDYMHYNVSALVGALK